jgi:hypothetical protein
MAERAHVVTQIGVYDGEGWRTHAPPGDVCAGCSDQQAGRWVPVSECLEALADYERWKGGLM